MSKPILFFVAGVVTTIVVAAILILPTWLMADALDLGSDKSISYNIVTTNNSPDGQHVATIYSASGGGAAGWCTQYVAITKKDVPFDVVTKDKESPLQVFNTTCRSEIALDWKDNKSLLITYSFTGSSEFGDHIYQKILSDDKEIKISFASK
jgi:hypothetical protein